MHNEDGASQTVKSYGKHVIINKTSSKPPDPLAEYSPFNTDTYDIWHDIQRVKNIILKKFNEENKIGNSKVNI